MVTPAAAHRRFLRLAMLVLVAATTLPSSASAGPVTFDGAPMTDFADSFNGGALGTRWRSAEHAQVSGECGAVSQPGALVLHAGRHWHGSYSLDAAAHTDYFYPQSGATVSFWARLGGLDAEPMDLPVTLSDEPCGDRGFDGRQRTPLKMQIWAEHGSAYQWNGATYCTCTTQLVWEGDPLEFWQWNYVEFPLPWHPDGQAVSLRFEYSGGSYSVAPPSWVIDDVVVQSLRPALPFLHSGTPVPLAGVDEEGVYIYDGRSQLHPYDDGGQEDRIISTGSVPQDLNSCTYTYRPSIQCDFPDIGSVETPPPPTVPERTTGPVDIESRYGRMVEAVEAAEAGELAYFNQMFEQIYWDIGLHGLDQWAEFYWDQDGDGENEPHERVARVENPYTIELNCIYEDNNGNGVADPADPRICADGSYKPLSGTEALPHPATLPGPETLGVPGLDVRDEGEGHVVTADTDGDGDHETELVGLSHRGWGFTGLRVLGIDVYQSEQCPEGSDWAPWPWFSGEVGGSVSYDGCNGV